MRSKNFDKKKIKLLNNIKSIVPQNLNLDKIKIDPTLVIDGTKKKIGNFYNNLKKERERNKIR